MKIVVAPDSFKGSLSALEVGIAIKRGLLQGEPHADVTLIPMADGGEGTLQSLIEATSGKIIKCKAKNPLGKEFEAQFGILGNGQMCIIEIAKACGLYLIQDEERNPLITTTYGVGQLIIAGLDHGCRQFILGLGGSATNDGGAGMLQALGYDLLDSNGEPIGFGGGQLNRIHEIKMVNVDPRLAESRFIIASDVDNPFIGPTGASYVFGPQKGATPEMVKRLDKNLKYFADIIALSTNIQVHDLPGTGAAGGLAGAIVAYLKGSLQSGVKIVAEMTQLEKAIKKADLMITGEGQIDFQTKHGKTPFGVAQIAQKHNVPVIALAGSVGDGIEQLYEYGFNAIVSIMNRPMELKTAMSHTQELLTRTSEQVMRMLKIR